MHSSGPELPGAPERLLDLCLGVLFSQRADFSFDYIDPRIEKWSGFPSTEWLRQPDLLQQIILETDAAVFQQHLAESLAGTSPSYILFRIRNRQTGRILHLAESRRAVRTVAGTVSRFEGIWMDVSRQTLAARQLDAAGWHAAFGLATLGAAHDLNNKLTAILSLSDLYLTEIEKTHPLRDGLATIKQSAQHASQLLHQLTALHQATPGHREHVDLNQFIPVAINLLRRVMTSRIGLETVLHKEAVAVTMDRVHLQRLIIAWALYAAERMPRRGTLRLETSRVSRGGRHWGALRIADSGDELFLPRTPAATQPLVVRESPDASTLDQLAAFASSHGGRLEWNSEGIGTTVEMLLPEANFTEKPRHSAKPWVLMTGKPAEELAKLARELENRGLVPVIAVGSIEEQLNPNWFSWDAVLIQETVAAVPRLLEPVRKRKLSAKIVVCLTAGDVSELEPWAASAAELVTPADWPRQRAAERIANLIM
jgi:signal transduction histidine kinase